MKTEFPNESAEYRKARKKLLKAESDLRARVEAVARMRRELPLGGRVKEDYVFRGMSAGGGAANVRMSRLFAKGKDTLLIYSFMYGPKAKAPCPMCSSILDGLNGSMKHVTQRANMVIVAKSPIERIMGTAEARGWNGLRFLSSERNTYNTDYLAENESGGQLPMMNVFVRRGEEIFHYWGSELFHAAAAAGEEPRHVDLIWPLWNLLDMTPEGRGHDWYPALKY